MNVFEHGALIDAALSSAGIDVSEMTEELALRAPAASAVAATSPWMFGYDHDWDSPDFTLSVATLLGRQGSV